MIRERVKSVSNGRVYTDSGPKIAIGNARHSVGDYVWTDGGYVFGHEPVRNTQVYALSDDVYLEFYYSYSLEKIVARTVVISKSGVKVKKTIAIDGLTKHSRLVYDDKNFAIMTPINDDTMQIKTIVNSEMVTEEVDLLIQGMTLNGQPLIWNAEIRDGELYWWYVQFITKSVSYGSTNTNNKVVFVSCKKFEVVSSTDISNNIQSSIASSNNTAANTLNNIPYASLIKQYASEWSSSTLNTVYGYSRNINVPPSEEPNEFTITDDKISIDNVSDFMEITEVYPAEFIDNTFTGYTSCLIEGIDYDNEAVIAQHGTYYDGDSNYTTCGVDLTVGGSQTTTRGKMNGSSGDTYQYQAYKTIDSSGIITNSYRRFCQALYLVGYDICDEYSFDGEISSETSIVNEGEDNEYELTTYTCTSLLNQAFDPEAGDYTYKIGNSNDDEPEPPTTPTTKVKLSNKYSVITPCYFNDSETLVIVDTENNIEYDLTDYIDMLGPANSFDLQSHVVTDFDKNNLLINGSFIYDKSTGNFKQLRTAPTANCNLQYCKLKQYIATKYIRMISQ